MRFLHVPGECSVRSMRRPVPGSGCVSVVWVLVAAVVAMGLASCGGSDTKANVAAGGQSGQSSVASTSTSAPCQPEEIERLIVDNCEPTDEADLTP